ncbi:MAG: serine hydrolase [Verrucomicrobiae bacterium]|nr:serine hydrolase [Verrucomicrobiae bacterium]
MRRDVHEPSRWLERALRWLALFLIMTPAIRGADTPSTPWNPSRSAGLQTLVSRAAADTLARFSSQGLKPDELAVTVVDLTEPSRPDWASYRGDVAIYPASVVKLFYLVATHRWLEDGRLDDTTELRRAMSDMIVDSSNDATHYLVDLLTGTTSGPELTDDALRAWADQRNAVNRYFAAQGFTNINVNKKPWGDGPYGREIQAIQRFQPSRNWLTTEATARLLSEIATGHAITPERSARMMSLLARDVYAPVKDAEDQTHGFTGIALLEPRREGVRLWSKAGWTSQTRHDAAYLELPDGRKLVTVVFTTGHAQEREIIPSMVRVVLEGK